MKTNQAKNQNHHTMNIVAHIVCKRLEIKIVEDQFFSDKAKALKMLWINENYNKKSA